MSETPFSPDEEAELYEELGFSPEDIFSGIPEEDEPEPEEEVKELEPKAETKTDARPDPSNAIVVQMPDISEVEFDDNLIAHLDLTDGQQRAEASRILFATYGGAAYGIPKGSHRSNWNSLIHTHISRFLGQRAATAKMTNKDTLAHKVSNASAQKVADSAALSTQAALKVLKDQILTEDGEVDMAKFAQLLKDA